MNPQPAELFRRMESLFEDCLGGARLREIVHVVVLAKVELARCGITLMWSLSQTNTSCRKASPQPL